MSLISSEMNPTKPPPLVAAISESEVLLPALGEVELEGEPGKPSHRQPLPVAHAEVHVADAEADTFDDGVSVDSASPVAGDDGKLPSAVEVAIGDAQSGETEIVNELHGDASRQCFSCSGTAEHCLVLSGPLVHVFAWNCLVVANE